MKQTGSAKTYRCKTLNVKPLNNQVYRIRFQLDNGSHLQFKGGQYVVLHMPDNIRVPLSIASAPEERGFIELHIRLIEAHSLAQKMVDLFRSANNFHIDAPCGDCFLNDSSRDLVIIAGGTGFSPMKSLIESAFFQQSKRQIQLFLGAQRSADLYQHNLIKQWEKENNNFNYIPVISGDDPAWQGVKGFPHISAIEGNKNDLSNKDFYISGSEPMVMVVYENLIANKVTLSQIYSDILNIKREDGEME